MQPMRLVTVKGRELAPSAATKAGAGGGHELALAGANGEGPAIRRQEQERVPEAGRPVVLDRGASSVTVSSASSINGRVPAAGALVSPGRRLPAPATQACRCARPCGRAPAL